MSYPKVKLGEVCEFKYGFALKEQVREIGTVPVYGSNGIVGFHNKYKITGPGIIIGRKGSIGKVQFSKESFWPIDTTYYVNEFKRPVDINWFVYLLKTLNLESLNKAAAVPGLNRNDVYSKVISLPSLQSQKKIAEILGTAETLRQKDKSLIEKYNQLTQSLFLEMFGDVILNSKKWPEVSFIDIVLLKRGYDLPVQERKGGNVPIIASNGIVGFHNSYKVKGPGVITGRSGTLGHVKLVKENYWPLNTSLYSQKMNGNNPTYLIYFLRNFKLERFSRGAGVPTLNRNLVHEVKSILPPLDLQNKFSLMVEEIENQKQLAEASLLKSEALFNSLLQKAFKGELVKEELEPDIIEQ